jgi:conjugative relaxase-like TrwC/TraI family protein
VLSIGKLERTNDHAHRGVNYYLGRVASGIEDYYTGAGEAPGQWIGAGAAELGLEGQVESADLRSITEGATDPRTGAYLLAGRPGARTVPGFDHTYSAPKSVSLLYAFGDDEVRRRVTAAHDAAVKAAVSDYLEAHALGARRGTDGVDKIGTSGAIAAAFRHRTSRAGDPDLHTHVLVANLVHGDDGHWSALDSSLLYTNAKTGGYVYQAQLRQELTESLGVDWGPVTKGQADIAGVDRETIMAFSERRSEILGYMAERNDQGGRAADHAALITRRAKEYGVDPTTLQERWNDKARTVGFERGDMDAVLGAATYHGPGTPERRKLYDELAGPEGLTAQSSTYARRDVVMGIAQHLPHGASVRDIERWTDSYLASGRAVVLADPLVDRVRGNAIRVRNSDRAGSETGAAPGQTRLFRVDRDELRYSTPELLGTEQRIIDSALFRRREEVGVVPVEQLDEALAKRPSLTEEQRAMVARLTASGAGVDVVAAAAGSGKTYALDAAREAWEASGHRVVGAGLAQRYGEELEAQAGIRSWTVDRMLLDLDDPVHGGFGPNAVLVVDEANTLGTRKLAALLDHAERDGAKVVLVGDPHQLQEIDAGGAYRGLAARLDASELTLNLRQRSVWEQEALAELRSGDPDKAMASYVTHGAVVTAETAGAIRQRVVDDYLAARECRDVSGRPVSAAMFAPRRADVEDLNRRARGRLAEAGELSGPEVTFGGRAFQVGDRVMATKNARHLGVSNGTRGDVVAIDAGARTLTMHTSRGTDVTLDRPYLESGHLMHGYASTTHKVEGMTVDAAFFLGNASLYREMAYTAMSRGRFENRFYLVATDHLDTGHGSVVAPGRDELLAEVTRALHRSGAEDLAVDTASEFGLAARTMAELYADREAIAERLAAAPRSPARELSDLASVRRRLEEGLRHAEHSVAEGPASRRRGRRAEPPLATAQARVADWKARLGELDGQEGELRQRGERRQDFFDAHREDVQRYAQVSRVIDRRERKDISRAVAAQPAYLTNALGPRPDGREARGVWQEGVGIIQRHRLRWEVADPERPLGAQPRSGSACAAHLDASTQLQRATQELARQSPARTPEPPARTRELAREFRRSR